MLMSHISELYENMESKDDLLYEPRPNRWPMLYVAMRGNRWKCQLQFCLPRMLSRIKGHASGFSAKSGGRENVAVLMRSSFKLSVCEFLSG
jgi:hypothetical protein